MNLRKLILYVTLALFAILLYAMLGNYSTISTLANNAGMSVSEFVEGSGSAFMMWVPFPLTIIIAAILAYLAWWDESLTDSYLRLRDKNDEKPIKSRK
jgi:hypothetical protein